MGPSTLVRTVSGGDKKESNIKVVMIVVVGIRFEPTEKVDPGRMPNLGVITITVTTTTVATAIEIVQLIAGNRRRGREKRTKKKGDDQNKRTAIGANVENENDLIRRPHRRLSQTMHQSPLLPRHHLHWITERRKRKGDGIKIKFKKDSRMRGVRTLQNRMLFRGKEKSRPNHHHQRQVHRSAGMSQRK
jgi:hypothetical protein